MTASLAACSQKSATDDKYAGLDGAIQDWHKSIEATPACLSKADGKGCQSFEVGCKGERPIAATDQAKGISARLVVAMSWEGWDDKRSEYRPASGFAEFNKVDGAWIRSDTGPVNLSTCASA